MGIDEWVKRQFDPRQPKSIRMAKLLVLVIVLLLPLLIAAYLAELT